MHTTCCSVVELRQYTMHPGQRDTLVDLFDREFVETQEAHGIHVVGQFRDLDRPDMFVWLRGYPDMATRGAALPAFYGGPVWKEHRDAANATMVDSDNVFLLRPAFPESRLPHPVATRPAVGADPVPASRIEITVAPLTAPVGTELLHLVEATVLPALSAAGTRPLACYVTEQADNNFPALPVRDGENVLVWMTRFNDPAEHPAPGETDASYPRSAPGAAVPALEPYLAGPVETLRLSPTSRSQLR